MRNRNRIYCMPPTSIERERTMAIAKQESKVKIFNISQKVALIDLIENLAAH